MGNPPKSPLKWQNAARKLAQEKWNNTMLALMSRKAFLRWIQVEDTALDRHGHVGNTTWSNEGKS
jgi:hypothetical protein